MGNLAGFGGISADFKAFLSFLEKYSKKINRVNGSFLAIPGRGFNNFSKMADL